MYLVFNTQMNSVKFSDNWLGSSPITGDSRGRIGVLDSCGHHLKSPIG